MRSDSGSPFNRLLSASFTILLATVALYCVLEVIGVIWPVLVLLIGVLTLAWVVITLIRYWLT